MASSDGNRSEKKRTVGGEEAGHDSLWGSIWEHINLAAPVICTFILRRSTDILSVIAVGHIGPHYLAAAGLATVTANVTGNSMIIGLAGALSTLCSQAYGAKDMQELGLALQRSFLILGLFVCLPVSFLWSNSAPLMTMLGQDVDIAIDAQQYMCTLIPSLWALAVSMCIQNWLYAQSNARPTAVITVIIAACHPGWLYLYVFYLDLGFLGAAMAVSTSKVTEVILLLLYVNCFSSVLKDTRFRWSTDCLHNWWPFIKLGLPNLLLLAEWWASEVIIFMAGSLPGNSDVNMSTMSIYQNLLAFCFMLPVGLHIAASTIVGNSLGAGQAKTAARSACVAPVLCVLLMVIVVGCIVLPLGSRVGRIFTDDAQVISELDTLVPVMSVYVVMDALQTSLTGVLKGMGKQATGVPVVLGCYVVLAIPLALYLSMPGWGLGLGVLGLAVGTMAGTTVHAMCFSALVYCLTDWEKEVLRVSQHRERYALVSVATNKNNNSSQSSQRQPSVTVPAAVDSIRSSAGSSTEPYEDIHNPMNDTLENGNSSVDTSLDNDMNRSTSSNDNGKRSSRWRSSSSSEAHHGDAALEDGTSWWDEISFLGPASTGSITAIRGSSGRHQQPYKHQQQHNSSAIGGGFVQLQNITLGAYNRVRLYFGAKLQPSEYELVRSYTDSLSPRHINDADESANALHAELDFDFL